MTSQELPSRESSTHGTYNQSEKGLHKEELLRMQTFLQLAYMCHMTKIPLR